MATINNTSFIEIELCGQLSLEHNGIPIFLDSSANNDKQTLKFKIINNANTVTMIKGSPNLIINGDESTIVKQKLEKIFARENIVLNMERIWGSSQSYIYLIRYSKNPQTNENKHIQMFDLDNLYQFVVKAYKEERYGWDRGFMKEGRLTNDSEGHYKLLPHLFGPFENSNLEKSILDTIKDNSNTLKITRFTLQESILQCLRLLDQLTNIDISNNNIGNKGAKVISSIKQLRSLDISNNTVGFSGLKYLQKMPQLASLNVGTNNIGNREISLLTNFTRLKHLGVGNNDINNKGAKILSSMKQLTSLKIGHNNIGKEGARHIKLMNQLTSLDIRNNNICSGGTTSLVFLKQLTYLNISSNNIGDEGAKALSFHENLQVLDVSRNDLGDLSVDFICKMKKLEKLDISWNDISSTGYELLKNKRYKWLKHL